MSLLNEFPHIYHSLVTSYVRDLTRFTCSCGKESGVPKSFCESCMSVIFKSVFMEGWRAALNEIQDSRS